jgi:hypothetical protein
VVGLEPAGSQELQKQILVIAPDEDLVLQSLEKPQNLCIFAAPVEIISAADQQMRRVISVEARRSKGRL